MSRPTDCRTDGARTSWPGRARRARASTACLALCVSLLAPAAGTAQARHKPATVRCVQGYCVTHFKVEITGSQATSWNEPQHQDGAADCYQVPYASGKGEQRIDFAATGLVR